MSFYSEHIFTRVINLLLNTDEIRSLRKETLKGVKGKTLEIGFGTGLNLEHYPKKGVQEVIAIDNAPHMVKWAQERSKELTFPVKLKTLNGAKLPFPDRHFDSVVSTFTLCSIAQVESALAEIKRVLKSGGQFFFLEHGRDPSPILAWLQDRLNPIQKYFGEGCHLNRDMTSLIGGIFPKTKVRTFYFKKFPKLLDRFYTGSSIK